MRTDQSRLSTELDPSVGAARDAREFVRGGLIDQVPAGTLADVLTVFTELVSNAVAHGDRAPIGLTFDWTPHEVSGEVSNRGTGAPEQTPIAARFQHLGLHIVNAIVDEWHASTVAGTTTVRFRQSY
jgi:anti-sigma regulatory factor (Ser/Thr protein kinase)